LVTKSFFTEKISIYDAKTGNKINAFSGDLPFALNLGWEILAMGEKSFTSNGKIELINIHTNKVIRRLECESDAKSLTFSPDGKYLVSGCRNGKIYVWGVVTSYEENRNHFEANKNAFNGEKVRASHILIDTRNMKTEEELEEAKKMIDEVKAMIDKGADFAEMAKKYSNCPSAGKGGDIGLFQRKDDKVVEEFAKVAFSMDVGDISEPIKTHFGYHIIKVTDKQEGKDVTYSDVTDTDNSNLILGSWKSEYSKTEYFRDGTFISNADTGKRYTGTWSIEGNILRLQFINPLRKLQIYTIIEMTDSTYKIKLNHADKHTSNARRVEPIKQSPDYTTEKSIIHLSNPRVRMETNYGVITLKLDSPAAPKTVENFLQYTQDGYYDGTIFHRVINEFMIQGGGINANMQEKPARNPIINEADNGLRNLRGTVAMARSNDPHSASSQFFINTANNISLDYKGKNAKGWGYCVFGKVVDGMDVVNTIENLPTITKGKYHDVPASPVIIESVIVENDSQQFNAATSGNNEKSYVYNKVSSSVFSAHNSRVYHKRNCSELNTDDLIEFASSQKADDAGGVPCKNCNPSVVVEGNTRQQDKPGKSRTTYEWTGWKSLFKSKD
jgi:peptidyl-prolyl cis-trans isomerase B (cyclophilin B)